jgi:hypothetical protein
MADLKTVGLLLLCAGGIYASYLTQGVVQEVLATKKFGTDGRYRYSLRFPICACSILEMGHTS